MARGGRWHATTVRNLLTRALAKSRLRAECKACELLRAMDKAQGKRTDLVGSRDDVDDRRTLSDYGITRDHSSRWQIGFRGEHPNRPESYIA
jgi:hypothetical protein